MLGKYDKIIAVTYSNGVPTYILTGWNIPSPDFEVDICANCRLTSETKHDDIVESNFVMHIATMDDMLTFAQEHDLMDRLCFDRLERLLVGKRHNIAISYLMNFNYID